MKKIIKGAGHPADVVNMRIKAETRAAAESRTIKPLPGVAGGHDGETLRRMARK